MANAVNYLAQIQTGQTIQANHVNQFVNALSGSQAYDLVTSGSYTIIGPLYATASWATNALNANSSSYAVSSTSALSSSYAVSASKTFIVDNGTTNAEYTLVFKNSTAALDNYHQLGADGTNGPYYNPSTNVLGGLGGLTVSGSIGRFTSITGSLSGSATNAVSASYAVTASYVTTVQTSSIVEGAMYVSGVGTTALFKFIAGSDVITGGIKTIVIPELVGRVLGSSAFPVATCSSSASPNGVTFVDSLNTATGALTFTANHNHQFFYHVMYI